MTLNDLEIYLTRAAEAREAADQTQLQNVKDRCLRAASAWEQMADRVRKTEKMRKTLDEEKKKIALGKEEPTARWPSPVVSPAKERA